MSPTMDSYVQEQTLARTKGSDRGKLVTYRPVSFTSGVEPAPYPPTATSFTLSQAAGSGSSSVSFSASNAAGQIKASDSFVVAGQSQSYTVTGGPYTASSGSFAAVSFTPALVANAALGAALTLTPVVDVSAWARVSSFPRRLIDRDLILEGDLMITIAKTQLSAAPKVRDVIVIDGDQLTVMNYLPVYVAGDIASYQIQAR